MPPILMIAPGRLVTLDQASLVLGIDTDYVYHAPRVDLPESFRLICHTDGLPEATSTAGQAFGNERLNETLLESNEFGSAETILSTITSAWTTHLTGAQAADDALVVVLARG
jgi:serine phosphatase RsbU (regulator of sigma subunit)